jgi:hypothetical protein
MRQRSSSPNCTQRTPAGLPLGIPGIGLVIDGAVQQAPHCGRHWKGAEVDSMAFEKWQTASIHRTATPASGDVVHTFCGKKQPIFSPAVVA